MPILVDPLPAGAARVLRAAVLDLRGRERRRIFGPVLHVGLPVAHGSFAPQPREDLDDALRADVVAALLRRTDPDRAALAWLTRSGPLAWHDADAAWLGPACRAFEEVGRPATFVVVTPQGWRDPRSGLQRVWQRLRPRS